MGLGHQYNMMSGNVRKMALDGGKDCIKLHKIRITYQITAETLFRFKLNIANVCMSHNSVQHSLKISTESVHM